jgi:DNA-binding NtrC family response regulator
MRVIYVEDDSQDIKLLSLALKEAEPEVQIETASTVAEAVTMLESASPEYSPYDILLADIGLPDGSGLSLVPLIRDRGLPMAVVVLTATAGEETAVAALRSGANDFVVKRGDYLQRLPGVIHDAMSRQAVEQAKRASPIRVLYAMGPASDLERLVRHLQRFRSLHPLGSRSKPSGRGVEDFRPLLPREPALL